MHADYRVTEMHSALGSTYDEDGNMKFRTILLASVMLSVTAVAASAQTSPSAAAGSSAQQINLSADQESKIKAWWASNKDKDKAGSASTTASSNMTQGSVVPASTQLQNFPSDLGISSSTAQYVQSGSQLCLVIPSDRKIDRCLQ
jgi:hypothetical protein